jgi:putative peptidoglycan lipid II flippase
VTPNSTSPAKKIERTGGALLVAAGILLSRVAGLIRQRIFAHYFGNSDAGDAFYSALKIPNFLQNLFGEGVLSASFIPVYSGLLGADKNEDAEKVARVVGSILALITSLLVVFGILATPFLIDLIAPGFTGEKRELTIRLVQIFFPGTGMLVMSAWCLGILNSHHKFFLSYAAPVLWNAAIIGALVYYGRGHTQSELAIYTAWGLVLGSALQFGIQLPTAAKFLKKIRFDFSVKMDAAQTIIRNFVPVVIARGVVQVSAYVDNVLASYLPSGAVSSLAYAQSIYMLPISLFGMAVSAAELPAMSRASGTTEEIAEHLKTRINSGLKQISFFIIPSIAGFLVLGDVIVAALYQSGEFSHRDSLAVWAVLAGSTIGLLATTLGRLYSSAFYSLKDTKKPLRFAIIRVFFTITLGYFCGLRLPIWLGISPVWGTTGLTASAGVAGWLEFLLLRRSLNARIGNTGLPISFTAKLWVAAIASAIVGFAMKFQFAQMEGVTSSFNRILMAVVVFAPFGIVYFGLTAWMGIDESKRFLNKLKFSKKA